jgi:cbb3-type cytochrome oxidase subunit 3
VLPVYSKVDFLAKTQVLFLAFIYFLYNNKNNNNNNNKAVIPKQVGVG